MKKKLIIFMTLVMALSLAGCSSSKLNANNTRTAKAIINAVDDYLNGEEDAATTYDLVNAEEDNIDDSDENNSNRLSLSIYTSSIITELIGLKSPSSSLSGDAGKIEENRNKIAELVGESKINTGASKSSNDESEEESFDGIIRAVQESKTTPDGFNDMPVKSMTFANYKFEYPEEWSMKTSDDGRFLYLYPTENASDGMVMLEYETSSLGNSEEIMSAMDYNIRHDDTVTDEGSSKSVNINGWFGKELLYTQATNGKNYATDACLIPNEDVGVLYVGLIVPEDSTDDFSEGFLKIILSMEQPDA